MAWSLTLDVAMVAGGGVGQEGENGRTAAQALCRVHLKESVLHPAWNVGTSLSYRSFSGFFQTNGSL